MEEPQAREACTNDRDSAEAALAEAVDEQTQALRREALRKRQEAQNEINRSQRLMEEMRVRMASIRAMSTKSLRANRERERRELEAEERRRRSAERAAQGPTMDDLPEDVLLAIIGKVGDAKTLQSVGSTCKKLRELAASDTVWREVCFATWGAGGPGERLDEVPCFGHIVRAGGHRAAVLPADTPQEGAPPPAPAPASWRAVYRDRCVGWATALEQLEWLQRNGYPADVSGRAHMAELCVALSYLALATLPCPGAASRRAHASRLGAVEATAALLGSGHGLLVEQAACALANLVSVSGPVRTQAMMYTNHGRTLAPRLASGVPGIVREVSRLLVGLWGPQTAALSHGDALALDAGSGGGWSAGEDGGEAWRELLARRSGDPGVGRGIAELAGVLEVGGDAEVPALGRSAWRPEGPLEEHERRVREVYEAVCASAAEGRSGGLAEALDGRALMLQRVPEVCEAARGGSCMGPKAIEGGIWAVQEFSTYGDPMSVSVLEMWPESGVQCTGPDASPTGKSAAQKLHCRIVAMRSAALATTAAETPSGNAPPESPGQSWRDDSGAGPRELTEGTWQTGERLRWQVHEAVCWGNGRWYMHLRRREGAWTHRLVYGGWRDVFGAWGVVGERVRADGVVEAGAQARGPRVFRLHWLGPGRDTLR